MVHIPKDLKLWHLQVYQLNICMPGVGPEIMALTIYQLYICMPGVGPEMMALTGIPIEHLYAWCRT